MPRPSALSAGVTITLGYLLVLLGGAKLNGLHWWLDPVFRLGMSDSVMHLVGWGEVLVGVLLVHRPFRGWGTRLFVAWMAGALTTHISAGDVQGAVVAAGVLVLGIVISMQPGPAEVPWYDRAPAPLRQIPVGVGATVAYLALRIGAALLFLWAVGGVLFWLALPVLGWGQAQRAVQGGEQADTLHHVLLYMLFFGYGVGGLGIFAGQVFLSETVVPSLGWLGFVALGSGIVGILCLWRRDRFWIAAGFVPSVFMYGLAFLRLREVLIPDDASPPNGGLIDVGTGFIVPSVVLGCLYLYTKRGGFTPAR